MGLEKGPAMGPEERREMETDTSPAGRPRAAPLARRRTAVEAALEAEYGPGFVDRVRASFDADLAAQLMAAGGAEASGDHDAVARAAHRIKGGAAAIGEHGVERAAAALERAARLGAPTGPALAALRAVAG